jgi:hypothetical protein
MPIPCVHFKLLHERVEALSQKFVADQATAEGADPAAFQPDLDRLAAYRLLVHAEIEDFLEEKAKDNIKAIESHLNTAVWMRRAPELLSLAVVLKKPWPLFETFDIARLVAYAKEILSGAKSAIAQNNGVKSAAFVLLSVCSGKTVDEIDEVLSASLNSYGKGRGDVAHKSVTHSTSLQAPSAELLNAKTLVRQLGSYFDVSP